MEVDTQVLPILPLERAVILPHMAVTLAIESSEANHALVDDLREPGGASDAARFLRGMSDPGQIADTAGYSPVLTPEQKVEVLETTDLEQRFEKLIAWGKDALAESSLKDKIRSDVSE